MDDSPTEGTENMPEIDGPDNCYECGIVTENEFDVTINAKVCNKCYHLFY